MKVEILKRVTIANLTIGGVGGVDISKYDSIDHVHPAEQNFCGSKSVHFWGKFTSKKFEIGQKYLLGVVFLSFWTAVVMLWLDKSYYSHWSKFEKSILHKEVAKNSTLSWSILVACV